MTVTDNAGASASKTVLITVTAPPARIALTAVAANVNQNENGSAELEWRDHTTGRHFPERHTHRYGREYGHAYRRAQEWRQCQLQGLRGGQHYDLLGRYRRRLLATAPVRLPPNVFDVGCVFHVVTPQRITWE